MADWMDWLEGLSGGASGIVNGLTAGAKPFAAWNAVQTQDLNNEKSAVQLRDLAAMQAALENPEIDYYGNTAAARAAAQRKATTQADSDIFGLNRNLDLQRYLSNPNDAFQQGVDQAGLTPGSPEYRDWLAQAIGMYNPEAGVKSYDTYGIPGIQQRNVNEQATLQFIEQYAQQKDPGARVVRNADGTVSIVDSQGQETPVSGDLLVKVASMLGAKTPYDAISGGLKDELAIQGGNVKTLDALLKNGTTGSQTIQALYNQRQLIQSDIAQSMKELATIQGSQDYRQADDATKQQLVADVTKRIADARDRGARLEDLFSRIGASGAIGRAGAQSNVFSGPPRAVGDTTVTTRPQPGAGAARAAGVNAVPGAGGMPGYPARRASPQDTGIRPITGATPNLYGEGDSLQNFINALLGGQ